MIPLCREEGIALLPWSPLAKGFLSGKYRRGQAPNTIRYRSDELLAERFFRPEDFDVLERAEEVAKEKDVSVPKLALAWLLHKGITAPIVGPTRVEHVDEAVHALEVKLSSDDIARLEQPYKPHQVMGHA
jgi:aryl-alcohol dehydrogenase-like predicted oxidoreductase